MKYTNSIFTEINYVPGSGNSIEYRCVVSSQARYGNTILSCGSMYTTSKKLQR